MPFFLPHCPSKVFVRCMRYRKELWLKKRSILSFPRFLQHDSFWLDTKPQPKSLVLLFSSDHALDFQNVLNLVEEQIRKQRKWRSLVFGGKSLQYFEAWQIHAHSLLGWERAASGQTALFPPLLNCLSGSLSKSVYFALILIHVMSLWLPFRSELP